MKSTITPLFVAPKDFKTVRQQYYYRWRFPDDVLFFQVGRFYEFYHSVDDDVAAVSLGLQRMRSNRRSAGFSYPVFQWSRFQHDILYRGLSLLFVRETEKVCNNIRERLADYRLNKVAAKDCMQ